MILSNIFQGDRNGDGMLDFKTKQHNLPKGSISDRENTMKASKWIGQKQKQGVKMPSTPITPSFPSKFFFNNVLLYLQVSEFK